MGFNEIVERILSTRRDLSREEVLAMVEGKKKEAEGYFTDEGAARVLASELGVKTVQKPFQPEIRIQDLVSGLNDVSITGRITTVYPPQTFPRPLKKEGKVARFLISDKSGILRVVLWDEKVSLVEDEKIKQGKIIRISHGYVREGLDGTFELHVGLRSTIEISPPEATGRNYSPSGFSQKIGEITREDKETNVVGIIDGIHPTSIFERDGRQGKVRRITLRDETGQITFVLWNKKVDKLNMVKKGMCIRVISARVREDPQGRLEIHTKKSTRVEIVTEPPELFTPNLFIKINELKSNMREVQILARVAQVGIIRKFRRRGETGQVATLLLRDETGSVPLNLWEEKAALSEKTAPGEIVLVEGAYSRKRNGKITLNVSERGNLTFNPKVPEAEELPPYEEKIMKIDDIKNEGGPITVEGIIKTTPIIREVTTTRGENVRVASFDLNDKVGEIKISLWRELADAVKDLKVGTRIKIKNTYVKKDWTDQLELTSRNLTTIETIQNEETA